MDHSNTGRLTKIREIFETVSDLPREEWPEFLEKTCRKDKNLRAEVEALLAQSEESDAAFKHLGENIIRPIRERFERDSMVGKKIAHYEILALVGRGGMGEVYKARDDILGRTVALKFLSFDQKDDPEAQRRFMKEAQAASSLEHPNIATVYEIGKSENDQLFIAMAYYPGSSLKHLLEKGPLPCKSALAILIQLADALAVAHRHEVIHRDIKPGNIIISRKENVKLLDFGLARFSCSDDLYKPGETAGTIGYMSPEQAAGRSVDHRSDIWALGVLLFELLTGERPFKGDNPEQVIEEILNSEPDLRPIKGLKASAPIRNVLRQCLAKSPDDRYQTADELLAKLKQVESRLERIRLGPGKFLFATIATVLICISIFITVGMILQSWRGSDLIAERKSVTLLPFANLNPNGEDSYFAQGLQEDILAKLALLEGLQVISKAALTENSGIPGIINKSNPGFIIEGAVSRDSNGIEMTIRVIDASSDSNVLSKSYDRPLPGVFDIQSDAVFDVAEALNEKVSSEAKGLVETVPTKSYDAYDIYLQARQLLIHSGSWEFAENYRAIAEGLDRSTRLDPEFLEAWVFQACNHSKALALVRAGDLEYDPAHIRQQAEEALEQVMKIDPENPLSDFARGCYEYFANQNYEEAQRHFRDCLIKRQGSAIGQTFKSRLLTSGGSIPTLREIETYRSVITNHLESVGSRIDRTRQGLQKGLLSAAMVQATNAGGELITAGLLLRGQPRRVADWLSTAESTVKTQDEMEAYRIQFKEYIRLNRELIRLESILEEETGLPFNRIRRTAQEFHERCMDTGKLEWCERAERMEMLLQEVDLEKAEVILGNIEKELQETGWKISTE